MMTSCNVLMMKQGTHAIPRTCQQCGLGPCPHYERSIAVDEHRKWAIGVSSDGPQVAPLACPMPTVPPAKPTKDEYFNPVCNCAATTGNPHAETCPITAWGHNAFRESGESAQGAIGANRDTCGDTHEFAGYTCTRTKGHVGPCALVPAENDYTALRDTIGAVINAALEDLGKQVDAPEVDGIAHSIVAMMRPDLIPVSETRETRLMRFYDAATTDELLDVMEQHIERLQAKVPVRRDEFPGSPRQG